MRSSGPDIAIEGLLRRRESAAESNGEHFKKAPPKVSSSVGEPEVEPGHVYLVAPDKPEEIPGRGGDRAAGPKASHWAKGSLHLASKWKETAAEDRWGPEVGKHGGMC